MTPQAMTGPLFNQLADLIRVFFGNPHLEVTRETSSLDVDGWDSLSHTVLLLRAESEFGVRLPLDRTGAIASVGELADLLHELTSALPVSGAEDDDQRWIILHGNCQMGFAASLLGPILQPYGYQTAHVASFSHHSVVSKPEPEQVARCAVFVEQVSTWESFIAPTYQADLPGDCRRLRVPALSMKSLWPLVQRDPRNTLTEEHPFGKYPYGDFQVMRLLRQTTDPEVVFQQYMETDIRKVVDLDRFHEMAMAEAAASDKLGDLPFAPILEQNFRAVRLFDTVNHPSHDMQMLLRDVIAEFVLDGAGVLPAVLPPNPPLPQVPVHPQVVEHFQLEWTSPDASYFYFGRTMTFEQYLRSYIAFE